MDGIAATKFKVTFAENKNGRLSGLLWLSADNIILAIDGEVTAKGKSRPFKMSLANIRIGSQPDHLFEVPTGYSHAPPARSGRKVRAPVRGHEGLRPANR